MVELLLWTNLINYFRALLSNTPVAYTLIVNTAATISCTASSSTIVINALVSIRVCGWVTLRIKWRTSLVEVSIAIETKSPCMSISGHL